MMDAGSLIPISATPRPSEPKEEECAAAAGIFGALFCDAVDAVKPAPLLQALLPASGEAAKAVELPVEGFDPRPAPSPTTGETGKAVELSVEGFDPRPVPQAEGAPLPASRPCPPVSAETAKAVELPVEGFVPKRPEPQTGGAPLPVPGPSFPVDAGMPVPLQQAPLPTAAKTGKTVEVTVDGFGHAPAPQPAAPLLQLKSVAVAESFPLPAPTDEKTVRLENLKECFDQRMLSMMQRGERVTRITVEPASLGRVTVVCREEHSTMSVEILAQSQPVRELLAAQEGMVRRLMESHSFSLGSFDVSLDRETDGKRRFGTESHAPATPVRGTSPAIETGGEPHAHPTRHKRGAVSLFA